jgi:putative NADPH-quinone reductase
MKLLALNGSPRKGWNSDEMLEAFINGVKEANSDIEVEKVNIYDLLRDIKTSDGFVFAAPVYYFDVPSQMRAILERLFYPGESEREIPVATIYTMNQKQENMNKYFKHHLDDIAFFFRNLFKTEPEQIYIYNTLHWKNPEKYQFPMEQYTDKVESRKINKSADWQSCHDAGVRLAKKISQEAM